MKPVRLIESPPSSGSWNMAVDEALMGSVREGAAPVLRFYAWAPACLSLGRNQPAADIYDRAEIACRGLDVVRRPTGGRAVVHAREVTYSVIVPEMLLGGPRESYAAINRALVAGLRDLGVDAVQYGSRERRAPVPSADPCFLEPAEGEVVVGGRKLVGSAQVRERGVMLQHGSLLLHDDQALLTRLERQPRPPAPPPAVLTDYCNPLPSHAQIVAALAGGWERTFGSAPAPARLSQSEEERARQLVSRHRDLEWIWRR